MMALENLLTPKLSPDEPISYKFRVSGALFLGEKDGLTVDKRKRLFNSLYSLRSKIVHGDDILEPLGDIRKDLGLKESENERAAILRNKNEMLKWQIPIETAKRYAWEAIRLFHKKKLLSCNQERRKRIEKKILGIKHPKGAQPTITD